MAGFNRNMRPGLNGALATLVALTVRDLTDIGQHVDLSIFEVLVSTMVIQQPYYSFAGAVQGRRAPEGSSFGQIMPCKDGYFVAQVGGQVQWETVAEFFDRDVLREERFADNVLRGAHGPELEKIVLEATASGPWGRCSRPLRRNIACSSGWSRRRPSSRTARNWRRGISSPMSTIR